MVTGAAVATTNRIPVLLLPGDVFATRRANPVLQELEDPTSLDISVNDALRPVSKYFDRIWRPEQLPEAMLHAMRVLTDPAETGAVTLALPQDVQTEAWDFPESLFEIRVWRVRRPPPETQLIERLATKLRTAKRPLLVAGGGVIYSAATESLTAFAAATGIPVAETQAGKGSLRFDHAQSVGSIGATGSTAANEIASGADLVIGIGTRWSDFTTASHSVFQNPQVEIVNVNVTPADTAKLSGLAIVADAREAIDLLALHIKDWRVSTDFEREYRGLSKRWNEIVEGAYHLNNGPLPAQSEVVGAVEESSHDTDVVVAASGSLPGDLHKLWRSRDPKGYHVEYAFSCMGYEIAAGVGVKMAAPEREVYVLVGDGSYLMLNSELVTALQEGIKLIVVLVVNHGFQSIGALSESVGVERFGTAYRLRDSSGQLAGAILPIDLATNAASLGATVIRASSIEDLRHALQAARSNVETTVIHIETDPLIAAPDSASWWDVPVAEVSSRETTQEALNRYEAERTIQREYFRPTT
jgi:3D-(3,5/4)-trihydroxycyclohexane-1,2-dione acylhydrolase (decyclizing)